MKQSNTRQNHALFPSPKGPGFTALLGNRCPQLPVTAKERRDRSYRLGLETYSAPSRSKPAPRVTSNQLKLPSTTPSGRNERQLPANICGLCGLCHLRASGGAMWSTCIMKTNIPPGQRSSCSKMLSPCRTIKNLAWFT